MQTGRKKPLPNQKMICMLSKKSIVWIYQNNTISSLLKKPPFSPAVFLYVVSTSFGVTPSLVGLVESLPTNRAEKILLFPTGHKKHPQEKNQ